MLPIALISPTSFLMPAILTRTCEPLSMVRPSWSVNWGGVAFASYLHVLGINYIKGSAKTGRAQTKRYARQGLAARTKFDTNSCSGPAWQKKP